MNWFVTAFKRFAQFKGRAGRPEYWYFTVLSILISFMLSFADMIAGTYSERAGIGLFSGIFSLVFMIPAFAVTARRLHDANRSGWWILIGVVPIVGAVVLLVFMCLRSDAMPNRFGAGPGPEL